jgi:hypothetical protein
VPVAAVPVPVAVNVDLSVPDVAAAIVKNAPTGPTTKLAVACTPPGNVGFGMLICVPPAVNPDELFAAPSAILPIADPPILSSAAVLVEPMFRLPKNFLFKGRPILFSP